MEAIKIITIEELKHIVNGDFSRFHRLEEVLEIVEDISTLSGTKTFRFNLYTEEYRFRISANEGDDSTYLGCTVSTRKPRAGEAHTRGNDLHDGKLTRETWRKIKNDIISYSLVPLVKRAHPVADSEQIDEV